MNCPKCGFDQPDAHECVKCGVVISKYISAMKRREELDAKPVLVPPAAVLEREPAEPVSADLLSLQEDSHRIWGEIHYVKADMSLLTDTLRGLQKRQEDLAQALAQCASLADVKKLSQEWAESARTLGSLHTTVTDLSGLVARLRTAAEDYPTLAQAVARMREELNQKALSATALDATQRMTTALAQEVEALKTRVASYPEPTASSPPSDRLREQLSTELQALLASSHAKLQSALHDEVDTFQTRLNELASALAEVDRLKASVTGLAAQLERIETRTTDRTQAELAVLRERFESLAPRVAELDPLKASLEDMVQRLDRSETPRADLTALTSRLETLEALRTPEPAPEWRELKEDVRTIKAMLSDFMQQLRKANR